MQLLAVDRVTAGEIVRALTPGQLLMVGHLYRAGWVSEVLVRCGGDAGLVMRRAGDRRLVCPDGSVAVLLTPVGVGSLDGFREGSWPPGHLDNQRLAAGGHGVKVESSAEADRSGAETLTPGTPAAPSPGVVVPPSGCPAEQIEVTGG